MIEQVGRVAFLEPNQQSSVAVLLNTFTFEGRAGATEDQIRAEAAARQLTVSRRADGRYLLTPADPLMDPIEVGKLADAFAASSVVAPGSLRPDLITPVQRR
jgi:hypothetical protein